MVVGPIRPLRAQLGRVPVAVSLALPLAADDRARGAGVVHRDGVPDAHLHRRPARHALTLLRAGARNGAHVVSDAGRV